jgi:hypothetical protein
MAQRYRDQVGALREALTEASRRAEAAELIRGLVERVEFRAGNGSLTIDLYGHLASILSLAADNKKPAPDDRGGQFMLVAGTHSQHSLDQIKLVAGVRNHCTSWPDTLRDLPGLQLPNVAKNLQISTTRSSKESQTNIQGEADNLSD